MEISQWEVIDFFQYREYFHINWKFKQKNAHTRPVAGVFQGEFRIHLSDEKRSALGEGREEKALLIKYLFGPL